MNYNRLLNLETNKILVIGDIMLDVYQYGKCTRISPEAPVPVIDFTREEKMLGGAGNVLRNLISNAIKFTYAKGEIQLYSVLKNGFVEVCIKDNGIGIPFENQINLFNVEVKSTSLGTSNEQGSGLGLILCKDFIEKNGGQIWVESEPNIGSAFKFTLPIFSE